jgi:virginiamycin B lyase
LDEVEVEVMAEAEAHEQPESDEALRERRLAALRTLAFRQLGESEPPATTASPRSPAPSPTPRSEGGIRRIIYALALALCAALVLCGALTSYLFGHVISFHVPRVASSPRQPTLHEYALPHAHSLPFGITVGSDSNVWFTEYDAHAIGRITPKGVITEHPLPAGSDSPFDIVTGADGNLWFNEDGSHVGRMTPAGLVTRFALPRPNTYAGSIAAGPDGNLWFTEYGAADAIGRITPAGAITEFSLPHAQSEPFAITAGHDGNLWFTEVNGDRIGRITAQGTVADFAIPTARSNPDSIAAGPDSAVWFTEYAADKIGRITPDGHITEYPLVPTSNPLGPDNNLNGIAADRAGGLWVTLEDGGLARITTRGSIVTRITLSKPASRPVGVVQGTDGSMWFTEAGSNRIGQVQMAGA